MAAVTKARKINISLLCSRCLDLSISHGTVPHANIMLNFFLLVLMVDDAFSVTVNLHLLKKTSIKFPLAVRNRLLSVNIANLQN